jgi:uncharacterized protein (TIGR02145 family)
MLNFNSHLNTETTMRTKLFKIAQAATFGLAITFTLSCSSSDNSDVGGQNLPPIASSSECAGIIFNPANKFCYDSGIYDKCDGMEYIPVSQICTGGVAIPAKCNGESYNPLTQDCCGSSTIFSKSTQRCASGIVETKCGSGWYNAANTDFRCQESEVEIKCGDEWYNTTNSNLRCQESVIETTCGSGWYDASNFNLRCQSNVIEAKCGTNNWYNTATQFCHTDNTVRNKCGGSNYDPATQYCSNGTAVGDYGSETYDGKTYKTVVIGNQTWMTENLNAAGGVCYENLESNCAKYGRLYSWATAMTVCPSGWHLPTQSEWNVLIESVGGSSTASKNLKATSGWNYCGFGSSYSYQCEDKYEFAALPGGSRNSIGGFDGVGAVGYWWSATEGPTILGSMETGYCLEIPANNSNIGVVSSSLKSKALVLSVRCLRD